ncbi:MAG: glycogen synthase [Patescibacteria group bacterium]
MIKKLRIISLSAEMSPFAKTGGLGDVALHLPKELIRKGQEVFSFLPFYGFISPSSFENKIEKILEEKIEIDGESFLSSVYRTEITKRLPKPLVIFLISEPSFFGKREKLYGYQNDGQVFYFFCFTSLFFIEKLNLNPSVIHCHDWHTALIPFLIKNKFFFKDKKVPTLLTIHNMAYQGPHGLNNRFVPPEKRDNGRNPLPKINEKEKWNLINFLKRGILFADIINTVSERYREEILTPEFGEGLEKYCQIRKNDLYGIINGIDYSVHNPKFDKNIYFNYDWQSLEKKEKNKLALQKEVGLEENLKIPLIGLAHRLTEQKGFDLIIKILPTLLKMDLQIIMVGSGKKEYEKYFARNAERYPKKLAYITPFSEVWESKIDAGSDLFLLPSRFEPCGISQLKSLRYGSIPIVRKVGGLADTIKDWDPQKEEGNGFVFSDWHENDLLVAIARAIEAFKYKEKWKKLVKKAMRQVFSWDLPANKYIELYKKAIEKVSHLN